MASAIPHEPTTGTTVEGEFYEKSSGWTGWIIFASVMMVLAGALNAMHGLVAILNDEWVVFGNRADLYLDLTTWGWIHLGVGVAVVLAGFGLLTGNVLARAIAVLLAGGSIVANFLYIPAFPVWALTVIAIDVFVIFALTAHGRDLA
jgi:hypothetical protein